MRLTGGEHSGRLLKVPADGTRPTQDKVRAAHRSDWGVGAYLYSFVLTYDAKALKGPAPKNWKDFWGDERRKAAGCSCPRIPTGSSPPRSEISKMSGVPSIGCKPSTPDGSGRTSSTERSANNVG